MSRPSQSAPAKASDLRIPCEASPDARRQHPSSCPGPSALLFPYQRESLVPRGDTRRRRRRSRSLLGLAENEKRLRIDAVVLHGIRGGLALHDLLECLHVGDLGDERRLIGPVWVPERPNGDAHRPKHFLTLRRTQPMLDIVHFVGDDVGSHRDRSLSSRTAGWMPPAPLGESTPCRYRGQTAAPGRLSELLSYPGVANAGREGATREVAGSKPAAPIVRKPCSRGAFVVLEVAGGLRVAIQLPAIQCGPAPIRRLRGVRDHDAIQHTRGFAFARVV